MVSKSGKIGLNNDSKYIDIQGNDWVLENSVKDIQINDFDYVTDSTLFSSLTRLNYLHVSTVYVHQEAVV